MPHDVTGENHPKVAWEPVLDLEQEAHNKELVTEWADAGHRGEFDNAAVELEINELAQKRWEARREKLQEEGELILAGPEISAEERLLLRLRNQLIASARERWPSSSGQAQVGAAGGNLSGQGPRRLVECTPD
ncbi:hypothetical protein ACIBL8_47000 [Streptomyces sp. NPDC050523]|uniref:hypothetical protein n=1 Tax=Streptomyces sp. NPDC050523 TaxID=3365622 RepID=UPI0037ADBA7A